MDTMINVWTVVEHVRVASGAAELAIFTAILYWFFTSSRVADMLEVVGERVGGWCGRESSGASSLRQAVRARKRHQQADIYSRLDAERQNRATSLYRVKEGPVVVAPQPPQQPPAGLACARCAPLSRESWQDPKGVDSGLVTNVLDIGRQNFANGGVISRYFCDVAECLSLRTFDYKDVVPDVVKDEGYQRAIEETTQEELKKALEKSGKDVDKENLYTSIRKKVEAKAMKVLVDISSAMSNNVLRFVAWVCHKAIGRIAGGGCGTKAASVERLRRARAAGLPLVFVPLHRSHFDYILTTFCLYLCGLRPPLVVAGDNMRIPFFGWFLRGCGAFYIRRRVDGSDYHGDNIYKTALRAYILNSLAVKNNLEFFIEGGRTRTGKPQPPKAGILSVIMDAYLDGTIDDALLVPVTLNYDKLVDGNFVREQLGRPKQMETFWSALRGIWHTLNTNHGAIRVDFNQPISLKELVTSFQKFNYLKAPSETIFSPLNNNSLALNLDKQILYNNSNSSLYGADVSTEHKMMVEAIGRHIVFDAAQSTALMSTNVVSYVLLTEVRKGATRMELYESVRRRGRALVEQSRPLGYSGGETTVVTHALELLGRPLVRRLGSGDKQSISVRNSIPAQLEMAYYANTVVAHYAAPAIVVTAIESLINAGEKEFSHSQLIETSLQLCAVMSHEFILCAPCRRTEELLDDTVAQLVTDQVLMTSQPNLGLEEQQWSRRFAKTFDNDSDDDQEQTIRIKYTVSDKLDAIRERRRLVRTIRPLLEAYAATCRCLKNGTQKSLIKTTLDTLTESFTHNTMTYGEAVSSDAIRNCMRLLKQWGVIRIENEGKDRVLRISPIYENKENYDTICNFVYKFNMNTTLLNETD